MKVSKAGKYRALEFRSVFAKTRQAIRIIYIHEHRERRKMFLSSASINPKEELRRIWKETGRDSMWYSIFKGEY